MTLTTQEIVALLVVAAMAFLLGRAVAAWRLHALRATLAQLERRNHEHQHTIQGLQQRQRSADETIAKLQRSIVELPDLAERLSAARDLREIPDRTLDLVQEIFDPTYSAFYRTGRGDLVAAATRGQCEFRVGHRVKLSQGIVGWTALKQLPFTPRDAEFESASVRMQNLAECNPAQGFSLCLPITQGTRTLGVVLIGPAQRNLPHAREIGRTIAMIAAVTITSTVVLKKQKALAQTDGLTGLLNKTHILGRLREALTLDGGPRRPFSLFLFDIDHFKHYNDHNGHLPGDDLLRSLGALLREGVREGDLAGRYGGEEFLLAMPGVGKAQALQAADRIRKLIADSPFPFREAQPGGRVTISGGVATWPEDGNDLDELLSCADQALYQAKRAGRNRVYAHAPTALTAACLDDRAGDLGGLPACDKEE